MAFHDSEAWQQAMFEEYQSIEEAGTWTLHNFTELPLERKAVGSR